MGSQQSAYIDIVLSSPSLKLAAATAEVLAPVFAEESSALYGTVDAMYDEICRRYADAVHVATAREEGRIVGACCLEDTRRMAHWRDQGFDSGFEVAGLGVVSDARGRGVASRLVEGLVAHVGFTLPILACTWAGAPSTAIFSSWTHLQTVPLQGSAMNVWRHPKSGDPFNSGPYIASSF